MWDLLQFQESHRKLIRKMLPSCLRGIEIAFNRQANAATHHAVAVATAKRRGHTRHAFVRYTLQKTNVESNLVPLDGRADDQDEGQGDLGVPLLGGLEDQIVERLTDLVILTVIRVFGATKQAC